MVRHHDFWCLRVRKYKSNMSDTKQTVQKETLPNGLVVLTDLINATERFVALN